MIAQLRAVTQCGTVERGRSAFARSVLQARRLSVAVARAYDAQVARGELDPCQQQRASTVHLDVLLSGAREDADAIALYEERLDGWIAACSATVSRFPVRPGILAQITAPRVLAVPRLPAMPTVSRGVYVYGPVGSGKTMVMDLFASEASRLPHVHVVRTHFNDFMHRASFNLGAAASTVADRRVDTHGFSALQTNASSWNIRAKRAAALVDTAREARAAVRRGNRALRADFSALVSDAASLTPPSETVASAVDGLLGSVPRGKRIVVCLDEFQMPDIGNATLLRALVTELFRRRAALVATSNRPICDLLSGAPANDRLARFREVLNTECHAVPLDPGCDYREKHYKAGAARTYYIRANGKEGTSFLSAAVPCGEAGISQSHALAVSPTRSIRASVACACAAEFDFSQLCGGTHAAADYAAIARSFDTIFLRNVPVMDSDSRDCARRFIWLVDELYNHRCRLVMSAAAAPDKLFIHDQRSRSGIRVDMEALEFETEVAREGIGATNRRGFRAGADEAFAFARTVSRLLEMQSERYLATWRARQTQCAPSKCGASSL